MLSSHTVPTTIITCIFYVSTQTYKKFAKHCSKPLKQHKWLNFFYPYTVHWHGGNVNFASEGLNLRIWRALCLRFLGFKNIKGHSYIWTDAVLCASTLKIYNIDTYTLKHSIIFLLLKRMNKALTVKTFMQIFKKSVNLRVNAIPIILIFIQNILHII